MESVTLITQIWSGAILVSFGGGMVGMILWLMHVVVVGWWMVKPWKRFLYAQYHWKSFTEMFIASPLCALAFGYFVFPCNRCNKEHFELELELDVIVARHMKRNKQSAPCSTVLHQQHFLNCGVRVREIVICLYILLWALSNKNTAWWMTAILCRS